MQPRVLHQVARRPEGLVARFALVRQLSFFRSELSSLPGLQRRIAIRDPLAARAPQLWPHFPNSMRATRPFHSFLAVSEPSAVSIGPASGRAWPQQSVATCPRRGASRDGNTPRTRESITCRWLARRALATRAPRAARRARGGWGVWPERGPRPGRRRATLRAGRRAPPSRATTRWEARACQGPGR